MTDEEVEAVAYREPFEPYRLILTDGEELTVTQPRKVVVSGGHVAVVALTRRLNAVGRKGLRIIRVDRIVSIHPAESVAPGGRPETPDEK